MSPSDNTDQEYLQEPKSREYVSLSIAHPRHEFAEPDLTHSVLPEVSTKFGRTS
jgi:hypothetical protein